MQSKLVLPLELLPIDAIQLRLVQIVGNEFQMGSGPTEAGRSREIESQFLCHLDTSYWMAEHLITQAQFEAVALSSRELRKSPSLFSNLPDSRNRPVESVSWIAAKQFCETLSDLCASNLPDGFDVDLPTEAMWEYACRAGTTTRYWCGDSDECLDEVAWSAANSSGTTHPVGQKRCNAFGLYDMHGNVSELCRDEFAFYPDQPTKNWIGKHNSRVRVLRGGHWKSEAKYGALRSASRCEINVDEAYPFLGFRICLSSRELD